MAEEQQLEERVGMLEQGEEAPPANAEAETKARELGWVPEDEFRGDKAKWKPAEEFLDYADHMLPILRENNRKLTQKISAKDQEFAKLQTTVAEQTKILKALEADADTRAEESIEARLAATRAALAEANRDQEFDRVAELQETLTDLKLEQRTAKTSVEKGEQQKAAPGISAEFAAEFDAWKATNKWVDDPALAAASTAIGNKIIQDAIAAGETPLKGRAFLNEVTKQMDKKFRVSGTPRGDKVDGGGEGTSASSSSSAGSRYSSLPAEARRMCETQAKNKVGEGKPYKTLAAWQKRFAELYNEQE